METYIVNINKKSLSRLYSKYKNFDNGIISASRASYSKDENKHRTLELKTALIKLGYSVTTINSTYIENYNSSNAVEVHDKTFIVFDQYGKGNLRENLIKLGKKYEQDSISYCNANNEECVLIGTNKTGYPGLEIEKKLEKSMFENSGEFFSPIEGRPFIFEVTVGGKRDYDCARTSYNLSAILAMIHFDDFVLRD